MPLSEIREKLNLIEYHKRQCKDDLITLKLWIEYEEQILDELKKIMEK